MNRAEPKDGIILGVIPEHLFALAFKNAVLASGVDRCVLAMVVVRIAVANIEGRSISVVAIDFVESFDHLFVKHHVSILFATS